MFEAIRQARPKRLYVAADGPRPGREGEHDRCEEVRRIASSVDWPCELKTLFRGENVGCKLACSGGISWFFEQEQEGIIFEDDVLPHESLFPFCEELLERYRLDPRIWAISGANFHPREPTVGPSYEFSRYPFSQGWATWRRAWKENDLAMRRWPALRDSDWLLELGGGRRDFDAYWRSIFDAVASGSLNTAWDYQWLFSIWSQHGIGILPAQNLVSNIGFGRDATHTVDTADWQAARPLAPMPFPLRHPAVVEPNADDDRWIDLNVFGTRATVHQTLRRRLGAFVRRVLG